MLSLRTLLFLSFVLSSFSSCPAPTTITCQQLIDPEICRSKTGLALTNACSYNFNSKQCEDTQIKKKTCSQRSNEYECKYGFGEIHCFWVGTNVDGLSPSYEWEAKSNTKGKCESRKCSHSEEEITCSSFGSTSCEWRDSQCREFFKCEDSQTVRGCRRARFFRRCIAMSDDQPLDPNSSRVGFFSKFSCVQLDCKHRRSDMCNQFVNGFECFLEQDQCGRCDAFKNESDCLKWQSCSWQDGFCLASQCEKLTSPSICKLQSRKCEWRKDALTCALNSTLTNQYCFSEYKSGTYNWLMLLPLSLLALI